MLCCLSGNPSHHVWPPELTESIINYLLCFVRAVLINGNMVRYGAEMGQYSRPLRPAGVMLCRLDAACTAEQCWNYLRRQLYVMDTYCNAHNRTLNHTMLALHSYLSWAFILPLLLTGLDLAAALPAWSSEVCVCFWMPSLLLSLNTKVALRFIHAGPAQLPLLGLCSAPAPDWA